ncbi:MAG: phosphoribosyltransferase family protein [Actinomycetota bacterium]
MPAATTDGPTTDPTGGPPTDPIGEPTTDPTDGPTTDRPVDDPITGVYTDTYPAQVGSQAIDLPLIALNDSLAISLLITVDVPLSFIEQAGVELAEQLAPFEPDVVAAAATLGIPVGWATARALGHDEMVVLHKTPKTHLADGLVEPLSSITTEAEQAFRLDRKMLHRIEDRNVVLIDDVFSTGGTAAAGVRLLQRGGGRVVALGALLTEGDLWKAKLPDHVDSTVALGTVPVFEPVDGGGWTPTAAPDGA